MISIEFKVSMLIKLHIFTFTSNFYRKKSIWKNSEKSDKIGFKFMSSSPLKLLKKQDNLSVILSTYEKNRKRIR